MKLQPIITKIKKNDKEVASKEETIIYPSNTKKIASFEEKQNEYLNSLSKENSKNKTGKPNSEFTFKNFNKNNKNIVY